MRPEQFPTARVGAALVLALHAAVLAALLSYQPARSALLAAAPIMVEWITPPKAEALPQPEPLAPPKPKPVVKHEAPRPVAQAPTATAAQASAPESVPESAPVLAPPAPAAVPREAVIAAPAPAPAPLPVTPPLFNADYLQNPAPAYPALSRRMGEQGRVILRVLVNPDGAAEDVQLRSSSGYPRLDAAARDTVRRWKFNAARRGAEPVSAWVLIPIYFTLEG